MTIVHLPLFDDRVTQFAENLSFHTLATHNMKTVAVFVIAHLVSRVIYHADGGKEKSNLRVRERESFIETKDQIRP